MPYIETFLAYDENEIPYSIVVNGNYTSDGKKMIKDYSLETTGEVLGVIEQDKSFLVKSTNVQLIDIRRL